MSNSTTHPTQGRDRLCEPLEHYCQSVRAILSGSGQDAGELRVVELFAGVGGFRVGLERASSRFRTVWSNQWEPSTKRQDASLIYSRRFGPEGHSNVDINSVASASIPDCDLLCGGFPCQDYSVATSLKRSAGIEGKKGILWWQIFRILYDKGAERRPRFLMLENVDRLLNSPASQRGRDFAIILSSLAKLGYAVEWRVINAAEYGMPQRRRRTYMMAYGEGTELKSRCEAADKRDWIISGGIMPRAFPCEAENLVATQIELGEDIAAVSDDFNKGGKTSPFGNSGVMCDGVAYTIDTAPVYGGPRTMLRDIVVDEDEVPEEFFIPSESIDKWRYAKGSKSLMRVNKSTGFEYRYSEGAMSFPDPLDKASRTIITGEGGSAPSRFKHVILTPSGRYRRLTPVELERLNMFPDNHTAGASDIRRAFLMGNALVTGIVERIALALLPAASQSGRTGTTS